jgi:glycolate oxidase FAD binding subunit
MSQNDKTNELVAQVERAIESGNPLVVEAGASKNFYGLPQSSTLERLYLGAHSGIIDYAPDELVITARAGTPLSEISQLLKENNQILAFEPPNFDGRSTIGGVVASGLSGPRRPYSGAVRDYVLGVRLLTGNGKVLTFGGQVMKNVAGYDVSRLVVGAMGTLGVILDVSLKTLPAPEVEKTYSISATLSDFQNQLQSMTRTTPLSASAFDKDKLLVRLSGSYEAVTDASTQIAGEETDGKYWDELNNLKKFIDVRCLWRVSLAPASKLLTEVSTLIDWGGGQRWIADPVDDPRQMIASEDGHATLVKYEVGRLDSGFEVFHPLSGPVLEIHKKLKQHFDPHSIFNPGRMYRDI